MSAEENKALAHRWAEIYNQANLDLVDEIYAPDIVIHDPPCPRTCAALRVLEISTACTAVPSPTPR
jgi:ketosteroid isomerase-like protein